MFKPLFYKKPVSIKWSLFRSMTLLVVLIAGSIITLTYFASSKSLQDLGQKLLKQSADRTETELKNFFQPIYGISKIAQEWGEKNLFNLEDAERFNTVFAPVLSRFPHLKFVLLSDETGKGLILGTIKNKWINVETRPTASGKNSKLTLFDSAFNLEREKQFQMRKKVKDLPWYQEALALKERQNKQQRKSELLTWTHPYPAIQPFKIIDPAASDKELVITASTVIEKENNRFYILAFPLLLEDISLFTLSNTPSQNGMTFVMSDHGLMLGLPKDPLFQNARNRKTAIGAPISEIKIPIVQDLLKAIQNSPGFKIGGAFLKLKSNGKIWLAAAHPFFLGREERYWIVVAAPENDFIGEAVKRRNLNLLIALSALLFAFFMALFLARKYSVPLHALVEESEKIRMLNLTDETIIKTQIKEIQQLADAQQKMRAALKSFSTYIPTDVVKELVLQGEAAKIGGKTKNLTVMFTDIAGFTTIAESMSPEKLTAHMAEYFEALLEILNQEKATVDKFIGDAIVAFWGAPVENPRHAAAACAAALKLKARIHALNAKWEKEAKPKLPTRFGIATGPVLVGNVGASHRLNYTVLGDTVNLANRLEGINKNYNTEILASKKVKEEAGPNFQWRFVESVAVKGKAQAVDVFELLGLRTKLLI